MLFNVNKHKIKRSDFERRSSGRCSDVWHGARRRPIFPLLRTTLDELETKTISVILMHSRAQPSKRLFLEAV